MTNQGKPYRNSVTNILEDKKPRHILDIACGSGWLADKLTYAPEIDGIDAFNFPQKGYRRFFNHDINNGLPDQLPLYDAAVICEAMAYLQNPGKLIGCVRNHLRAGGVFIITDPNPLYIGARVNYLIQGFPRSHSAFVKNSTMAAHMPWMNLGLFQYWLLLGINGFVNIKLHDVDEEKPKHYWERLFGFLSKFHYNNRLKKSTNECEKSLWRYASSNQHIYGRRLVISAEAG